MTHFMSMVLVIAGAPPTAGQVSNDEAARLLRERFGSSATLQGAWTGDQRATVRVCADSGAARASSRLLAVCTSFADGAHADPGDVELFVLRAPGGPGRARISASLQLFVSGQRAGKAVKRSFLIPFRDGAYRVPEAVAREGCAPPP